MKCGMAIFVFMSILSVSAAAICNVKDFGAKGDGKTLDSKAINKAIENCDEVEFPPGEYISGSIHLKSNLVLTVQEGARIKGASNDIDAYDHPEDNPWDQYQDFGHSHWHDSLIWGENVTNCTIRGPGTIDGGGISHDTPPVGGGNKMFGLKWCKDITLSDITLHQTGWFAVLATDCEHLAILNTIVEATRDGLDIVGCRHVLIHNTTVRDGGDDALALKSDYSTGHVMESFNITVTNCSLTSTGCNAMQFGSETVGPFHDISWSDIVVGGAGKAGIGIVSADGSEIYKVYYRNIQMSKTTTPFFMYIGGRSRRPGDRVFGKIHDIEIQNVTSVDVVGSKGNWTSSIDGQGQNDTGLIDGVYPIGPGVVFRNVHITYEGGGDKNDVNIEPPHPFDMYQPRIMSTRPSYGWYIRTARGISLDNCSVSFTKADHRPAIIVDVNATEIDVNQFSAMRADDLDYDVGLKANGQCTVRNSPSIVVKKL